MKIGNIDVARAPPLGRQCTRIGAAACVYDLVAATMRQREGRLPAADARQFGGQISELMRDRVDNLAFALDLPRTAMMLAPITTRWNFSNT